MVAKLPESPDQTKRLRLSPLQFLNLNQSLLDNFTGDEVIQETVKTYQVANPTEDELQAHESHLYTKEKLGITKPVVAIIGTVASGKTTTIGEMCKELNYDYIDNGSLFRTIAYYLDKEGYMPAHDDINFTKDGELCTAEDVAKVIDNMPEYSCKISDNGRGDLKISIGDEDVSDIIRSEAVGKIVSGYGGNQSVMKFVLQTVTKICNNTTKEGIIIGSRDYGTFMLSDVDYSFYLDAPILTRLQRDSGRDNKLQNQEVTSESIQKFAIRDTKDIKRKFGSVRVAKNAKIINTGNGTAEEISEIMVRYIRQMEKKKVLTEKIAKAETYAELVPIAIEMMNSYIQENKVDGMEMVCGPISTGGLGTIDKNIAHFNKHIKNLVLAGNPIFDQTVFEGAISRIKSNRMKDGLLAEGQYDEAILTDFYQPLFESSKIRRMYFIPGREESKGATRERKMAQNLRMEIVDLEVISLTPSSPTEDPEVSPAHVDSDSEEGSPAVSSKATLGRKVAEVQELGGKSGDDNLIALKAANEELREMLDEFLQVEGNKVWITAKGYPDKTEVFQVECEDGLLVFELYISGKRERPKTSSRISIEFDDAGSKKLGLLEL